LVFEIEDESNQNTIREADTTRKCLNSGRSDVNYTPGLDSQMSEHVAKVINFKSNLKKIEVGNKNSFGSKINMVESVSNSSMAAEEIKESSSIYSKTKK
jgi:hypothetical protein